MTLAASSGLGIAGLLQPSLSSGQTPEQEKNWQAQRVQSLADAKARAALLQQQREARRADPMAWVHTLNPLTQGGWEFRAVAPDGSWAAYSTDHQMKRSRHLVTAWMRQEYPESQRDPDGDPYSSDVEKVEYDCANGRAKALLVIYYVENNLGGGQKTEESDEKHAPWSAIVPGTQSESLYQWACEGDNKRR